MAYYQGNNNEGLKHFSAAKTSNKESKQDGIINYLTKLQLNQLDDLLTDDEDDLTCENIQINQSLEDLLTEDEDKEACEYSSGVSSSSINFTLLYDSAHEALALPLLREKCDKLYFSITDIEANNIEKLTRNQANDTQWHELRKGRITASTFKSVCSTNLEKPSISLLTKICYPEKAAFTSKYTAWGSKHEKQALHDFVEIIELNHVNFEYSNSGLVVLPEYPFFGASPDGLCSCDCCGKGLIEIKCPYSLKNGESFDVLTLKTNPFLIKNSDTFDLNRKHAYYFQIQMQLFLTKRNYCYFIVWSPKSLLQMKILPDNNFWIENSAKAETFFRSIVLPELLGKYFTKNILIN